jgi:hypothetical protein
VLDEEYECLVEAGSSANRTGDVSGLAPPGDIHRVRNAGDGTAAAEDPEIRAVVRAGYGDLVAYARRVSHASPPALWRFFATAMLLNVPTSMRVNDDPEPWMRELLDGCATEL